MADRRSARPMLAVTAALAALAALAGCGSPAEPEQQSETAAAQQQHEQHEQQHGAQEAAPNQHHHHGSGGVELWATQTESLDVVVLDGAGRLLYRSDADSNNPSVSRCTGECTQRWEPLLLPDGQEPELLGVDDELVGTLFRDDGTVQLTLAGWPLYTAAGDTGDLVGTGAHGAEGAWFAVTPKGEKAAP